jgi:hypothetical protein
MASSKIHLVSSIDTSSRCQRVFSTITSACHHHLVIFTGTSACEPHDIIAWARNIGMLPSYCEVKGHVGMPSSCEFHRHIITMPSCVFNKHLGMRVTLMVLDFLADIPDLSSTDTSDSNHRVSSTATGPPDRHDIIVRGFDRQNRHAIIFIMSSREFEIERHVPTIPPIWCDRLIGFPSSCCTSSCRYRSF